MYIHFYNGNEKQHILLQNLVNLNVESTDNDAGKHESKRQEFERDSDSDSGSVIHDEEKDIEYVTTGEPLGTGGLVDGPSSGDIPKNNATAAIVNQVSQSVFVYKLDLLTSLLWYLDELIEQLVLFYCCFDSQSWIAVFYSFIEVGIGTSQCHALFAQFDGICNQVTCTSLCVDALEFNFNVNVRRK